MVISEKTRTIKPLYLSKYTSLELKGIAILMMVWLHLFNKIEYADFYTSIYLDGYPLPYLFANACNPVGIFCVLSGYGIYESQKKGFFGRVFLIDSLKRIIKLYVVLWIIYIFFIPLCVIFGEESIYIGEWDYMLKNLLAYYTAWNHTTWFIMPYSLVMLEYPLVFKLLNRINIFFCLFLFLILYYLIAIIYGRYYGILQDYRCVLILCRNVELLVPFVLGALASKMSYVSVKLSQNKRIISWISCFLMLLMFGYSCFHGMPVYPVYCVLFCVLFSFVDISVFFQRVLQFLGKQSMIIWLTHTFYFEVFFKEELYGLTYPIVIFCVTIIISLIISIGLSKLINPIIKHSG